MMIELVLLWVATYALFCYYTEKSRPGKVAQGPWRLPFIGNAHQLLWHFYTRLEYVRKLSNKFGDVMRFDILWTRGTFVSSPELVEHVLKTNFAKYGKGYLFQSRFTELLGNGIFNADGGLWKMQRKTASHMFSVKTMREDMCTVFQSHCDKLINVLGKLTSEKEFIDIQDIFFRFTLDSIGEIAFGHSINSIETKQVPFALAFDQVNEAVAYRFINPIWRLTTYILPGEYKLRSNIKLMNKFCLDVIQKRKKEMENGKTYPDVLSRFINMRDARGNEFSNDYLKDVILNFVIAGRDTTANALSWAVYELCNNPEKQKKVIEEVDRVLQGQTPTFDICKDLEYLDHCAFETLRLHPSVPFELKTCLEDDTLPTGHHVRKGELMAFLPYVVNRRPEIYKNPDAFEPERWSDLKVNAFSYPTFNAGPRTCLGQHMAIFEMKVVMAKLLQNYTISLQPGQHLTYLPTVTLPFRHGIKVHLTPRKLE